MPDVEDEGNYPVTGPSGAIYTALNEEEVAYWEDRAERYVSQNKFTNVSDLQEVDRLLALEMMIWRWSNWISRGTDYYGDDIDEPTLHKQIKEWSAELRLIKKAVGLDKPSREKDKGESTADFIASLGRRALEFGYHRNDQFSKILVLFNELRALITLMDNCTVEEQRENHCTIEDVMQWIREVAVPEYEQLDTDFRQKQKMWIRDL